MWIIHYRGYTQGAWRTLTKIVQADTAQEAKKNADLWQKLIIKIERI